jgi:alpha-galactosidase
MAETKIVIVGGGSYNTSPKILGDILLTKSLNGSTIVLYDIDKEKLKTMERLAQKMIVKAQSHCKVVGADNLQAALPNAEFVIATVNVGGFDTLRQDIEIPQNFGIYQSYGECVGPSGIMRALRTIPVFMEIVKDMELVCPNAWLINYTNPIAVLCRLVNKTSSIKVLGIANELVPTFAFLKKALAVKENAITNLKIGGINRLGWILDLKVDRKDAFPDLRNYIEHHHHKPNPESGEDQNLVKFELFKTFGYLPYGEDKKIAEFSPYFLNNDTQRGEKYGVRLVNLKKLRSDMMSKRDKIEHVANSKNPVNYSKSTSEMVDIVSTIANRGEGTYVMNIPNRGSISNLPLDSIVEVSGYINNRKISEPVIEDLPMGIAGLVEPHVINQELIVEAALKGNRKIVLQAMLLDRLIRNISTAEKILEQLLKAHKQYLPQFYG